MWQKGCCVLVQMELMLFTRGNKGHKANKRCLGTLFNGCPLCCSYEQPSNLVFVQFDLFCSA
jgi:hypothetical protein